VDDVAFFEQELREVGAVLSSYSSDESSFFHFLLSHEKHEIFERIHLLATKNTKFSKGFHGDQWFHRVRGNIGKFIEAVFLP
jgi:hypothetical protein